MRVPSWPACLAVLLTVSSCGFSPPREAAADQSAQDERPVIQTLTKEQLISCPGGFGSHGTLDYISSARGAASPLQAVRGLVERGPGARPGDRAVLAEMHQSRALVLIVDRNSLIRHRLGLRLDRSGWLVETIETCSAGKAMR
jgi:hypothetical protein